MFGITPELVSAFGPGVAYWQQGPEHRVLVLTGPSWVLVVPDMAFLTERAYDTLRAAVGHPAVPQTADYAETPHYSGVSGGLSVIDWRALVAEVVSPEEKVFIPLGEPRSRPMLPDDYGLLEVKTRVPGQLEQYRYPEDGHDLMAMYEKGQARTTRGPQRKAREGGLARTEASKITFTYGSPQRLVAFKTSCFEAVHFQGGRFTAPGPHAPANRGLSLPPLVSIDFPGGVYGVITPESVTGILVEASPGNDVDAGEVAWLSDQVLLSELTHSSGYRPQEILDPLTTRVSYRSTMGVAGLRWQGFSSAEIRELYDAGRDAALIKQQETRAQVLLEDLARALRAPAPYGEEVRRLGRAIDGFQEELQLYPEISTTLPFAEIERAFEMLRST